MPELHNDKLAVTAMLMAASAVNLYAPDYFDKRSASIVGVFKKLLAGKAAAPAAAAGKSMLNRKAVGEGIKGMAGRYALGLGFTSGFSTLTDEDMRERYGTLGTFGRKLITPKMHMLGLGTALTPAIGRGLRTGWVGGVKTLTGTSKGGLVRQTLRRTAAAMDPKMQAALALESEAGRKKLLGGFLSGHYAQTDKRIGNVFDALKRTSEAVGVKTPLKSSVWGGDNFADVGKQLQEKAKMRISDPNIAGTNSPVHKAAQTVGEKLVSSSRRRSVADVFNPWSIGGSVGTVGGMYAGINYGPWSPATAFADETSGVYKPFSNRRWDPYSSKSYDRHAIYQ